jgi:hypothetical protein
LTKPKAKKTQGRPQKRSFRWLWVALVLFIAVLAVVFTSQRSHFITPSIPEGTSAAIVDQLYSNYPNEDFTTNITEDLEGFGFTVDVYQGDDVTVDFYRNLPIYDYQLIVFRVHSGTISPNPEGDVAPTTGTYLFTNEPFNRMKYTRELLADELAAAYVLKGDPVYFVIGPKFITHSMNGNFNNTVVIVDGCSCLHFDDLAQAFTSKGASCYLAWDHSVELDYVDEATTSLVENLCSEGLPVKEAVDRTMATIGPDPDWGAWLKYYPAQSADETLQELIQ